MSQGRGTGAGRGGRTPTAYPCGPPSCTFHNSRSYANCGVSSVPATRSPYTCATPSASKLAGLFGKDIGIVQHGGSSRVGGNEPDTSVKVETSLALGLGEAALHRWRQKLAHRHEESCGRGASNLGGESRADTRVAVEPHLALWRPPALVAHAPRRAHHGAARLSEHFRRRRHGLTDPARAQPQQLNPLVPQQVLKDPMVSARAREAHPPDRRLAVYHQGRARRTQLDVRRERPLMARRVHRAIVAHRDLIKEPACPAHQPSVARHAAARTPASPRAKRQVRLRVLHEPRRTAHDSNRQPSAERLAVAHNVGTHPEILLRTAERQAEASGRLIENERDARGGAGGAEPAQPLAKLGGCARAAGRMRRSAAAAAVPHCGAQHPLERVENHGGDLVGSSGDETEGRGAHVARGDDVACVSFLAESKALLGHPVGPAVRVTTKNEQHRPPRVEPGEKHRRV
mmetsp:Transcript_32939/g.105037  ORF Transcript_32939/g.105037 Transcript_32939/m.105037 type:complete len:458 (-) Transcript_32939:2543-3916(-)